MWTCIGFVIALAAPGGATGAEPRSPDTSRPPIERAIDASRAGRHREAIRYFKASEAVTRRRTTDCNIARGYRALGETHRAWAFLDRCRRRWGDDPRPEARRRPFPHGYAALLVDLESELAAAGHRRIEVHSVPPGAEVGLSAFAPDERFASPVVLYLPPGPLRIEGVLGGRLPAHLELDIGPDTPSRIELALPLDPTERLAALRRIAERDPVEARAQWQALLLDAPAVGRSVEARLLAARLLAGSGSADGAMAELDALTSLERDPGWSADERARLLLGAARLGRDSGRPVDALARARQARLSTADDRLRAEADALVVGLLEQDLAGLWLRCRGLDARLAWADGDHSLGCDERWVGLLPGPGAGRVMVDGRAHPFEAELAPGAMTAVAVQPGFDAAPWIWTLSGVAAVAGATAGATVWQADRLMNAAEEADARGDADELAGLASDWSLNRSVNGVAIGAAVAAGLGAVALWLSTDDAPSIVVGPPTAGPDSDRSGGR